MVYYEQCKCIEDELYDILKRAVDGLSLVEPTSLSEEEQNYVDEIEASISDMRAKGVPESILANIKNAAPKDTNKQKFEDVLHYIQTCRCSEEEEYDWRDTPYSPITHAIQKRYSSGTSSSTSSGGRGGSILSRYAETCSPEQATQDISELNLLVDKYFSRLRDKPTLERIKNMVKSEEEITAGWMRNHAVELGFMTQRDLDRLYELDLKIKNACGSKALHRRDNAFLTERKEGIGLLVDPTKKPGYKK